MADRIMSTQHGRTFPNNLSEDAMYQNQYFPRNAQFFGHRNRSLLEYQLHDSGSDRTSSSNSSIFSSDGRRSSYFSSMSSLPSFLESPSQPSLLMPNNPSPLKIISREKPTERLYFCPICIQFKDQPIVYMKRKGEMKSHIERHFTNTLFHCDDCLTARDRFEDLKTHCKRVHGRPLRSTAMVGKIEQLMPQELFACGFRDWTGLSYCREVQTDSKSWFDHIAKHMERGSTPADWNYSDVIRNLMRQPELCQLWKEHLYWCEGDDKREWTPLKWDVDSSRTLMLKLSRRDFRPAVNHLLAWAYDLGLPAGQSTGQPTGQPACQPEDYNPAARYKIPILKPPSLHDLDGLSMTEIETLLKRGSRIPQDRRALPGSHDSTTMTPIEPVINFTGHIPQTQPHPESDPESCLNPQLASNLQGFPGHNSSISAFPQTNLVQYPPQPFHPNPNLPLDAGQPPDEANWPMGPGSHLLGSDTHGHADFGYAAFNTSTDYRGTAS